MMDLGRVAFCPVRFVAQQIGKGQPTQTERAQTQELTAVDAITETVFAAPECEQGSAPIKALVGGR